MGAASTYLWLYLLCGIGTVGILIVSFVLIRMGKGTEKAGQAHRIGGTEPPDGE